MSDYIEKVIKSYDFSFFFVMSSIFLVGIINLYSITNSQNNISHLVSQQLVWFIISLIVGLVISFIHPSTFSKFSYWIYGSNLFLLIVVLILGSIGMGAQRWIAIGPLRVQPSEFMKISMIFCLCRWFTDNSAFGDIGIKHLIVPFVLTIIPTALIIKQPDLGTGGIIFLIFLAIVYYRRLKWSSIIKLAILGIFSAGLMYNFVLKDYQKRRILTFIDPYKDAKNAGYNAIQSHIAIGSGKIFGKGFGKSSQASLNFLPEKHTDFVFSIFAEEHGFFGVALLFSLFFLFIYRGLALSLVVTRVYDSIFCIGLMSFLSLHVFINIAMVSGLFPIVGLPLPMMTYGGSSLLVFGILTGILTSISNSRSLF